MLITIGGLPGSGSSTVAKKLAEKTGLKHIDAGDIWEKMARERKTDTLGLNFLAEKNKSIDKELDTRMLDYAMKKKNLILEGRIIGALCAKKNIPAFKIWFTAPRDVRVKRICQREKTSFLKTKEKTKAREKSEAKRYLELYGIDISDFSIYDLIVSSEKMTPDEILKFILKQLKKTSFLANLKNKIWI